MNKLSLVLAISLLATPLSLHSQLKKGTPKYAVSDGELRRYEMYSPELQHNMSIDVWLPPTYDQSRKEGYPVIYTHDSQTLFDAAHSWNRQAWELDSVVAALVADGKMEAPIIVGIAHDEALETPFGKLNPRNGDLMPNGVVDLIAPEKRDDVLADQSRNGVKGDKSIDFIAFTLKSAIDSMFNTRRDAKSTAMMGSSMGGLISLYAVCRRPEVFGSVACLSTHIVGFGQNGASVFAAAMLGYLAGHLPTDGEHRIYVDTGTEGLDASYVPYFAHLFDLIKAMGYAEGVNFQGKVYEGATHNEDSWKACVAVPLTFLFPKL